jgi:tetratricopeptide (TPR) repeat protein
LPWNLAVGLNLKFDHQSYSGFMLSDVGTSATGIGTDVGVLFRPNLTHFMLDGLSVGLTVQNLIGSRLKMETATDINPLNVRFGLAKPFLKNEFGNQLTIFMDIEQGAKVPFKFHAGTEYVFQNMAMLRVGMNNSQLAFGAGAMFNMFQLDYSFGKFAPHDLSSSHRVSFSMHFGKSKDELIKIAAENRRQEMERMAEQQVQFERNQRIAESLERGKQYLKDGEYERALSEFNFIMQYERELPNAPVILEAKNLFEDADKKNKEKLTEEINKVVEHDAEKARRQREEIKLDNHFKQGMAYFEVDDYEKAIEQWNKMLEIDLGHKLAKQWIENARSKREQVILSAVTMADRYAREGKLNDAIRELNKARMLNPDERQMKVIEQRVEQVENQMDFFDLYRQGYQYYIIKDYQNAMVSFQKALSYSPNDEKVKKFLYNAEVRAKARKETMTEDVKQKFMDGYKSFAAGKYEEALRIWEVLQKKQPYNKQILDGIDAALEKLENQNKGSKK